MSESLEKLHKRILADAGLKGNETTREAEEKAKQIAEEGRLRARREADEILAKANLEAEAIRRGVLSAKVRANRLRILKEKNEIVQKVLKTVENRLSNITGTAQFEPVAKRFVAEAVDAVGSDQPVVRVGFRGASKKELDGIAKNLTKGSKFVVEDDPIDELGGVIATDPAGKVTFKNSFRSRLERMDNRVLTLISSSVFGE